MFVTNGKPRSMKIYQMPVGDKNALKLFSTNRILVLCAYHRMSLAKFGRKHSTERNEAARQWAKSEWMEWNRVQLLKMQILPTFSCTTRTFLRGNMDETALNQNINRLFIMDTLVTDAKVKEKWKRNLMQSNIYVKFVSKKYNLLFFSFKGSFQTTFHIQLNTIPTQCDWVIIIIYQNLNRKIMLKWADINWYRSEVAIGPKNRPESSPKILHACPNPTRARPKNGFSARNPKFPETKKLWIKKKSISKSAC